MFREQAAKCQCAKLKPQLLENGSPIGIEQGRDVTFPIMEVTYSRMPLYHVKSSVKINVVLGRVTIIIFLCVLFEHKKFSGSFIKLKYCWAIKSKS